MEYSAETFQLKCLLCLKNCNSLRYIAKCKHSFCENCLKTIYEENLGSKCPICLEWVTGQPSPDDADHWLKSLYSNNRLNLRMRMRDTEYPLRCEPCSRRQWQMPAGIVCALCEELLCENCGSVHRRSKSSRSHQLFSLQDEESVKEAVVNMCGTRACDRHTEQPATIACLKHEALLCKLCTLSNHKTCSKSKLTNERGVEDMVERYRKGLLDVKTYCDELFKTLANDIQSFTASVMTMKDDIAAIRKTFNEKLDHYEQEFLEKAEYIKEMKLSEINESINLRSSISMAINYDLETLETILQKGSVLQTKLHCVEMTNRPHKYRKAMDIQLPKITVATFEHRLPKDLFAKIQDNVPVWSVSCWLKQASVLDLGVNCCTFESVV